MPPAPGVFASIVEAWMARKHGGRSAFHSRSAQGALMLASTSVAPAAHAGQNEFVPPPLSLHALSTGTITTDFTPTMHLFPLNAAPVNGFVPHLVFTMSDDRENDFIATPDTTVGGNPLPHVLGS